MDIRTFMKDNLVVLDGGMGTLLQQRGLAAGERPETWNLTHADVIVDIHRAYYESGSNIVVTNTFGANLFHYSKEELEKIIPAAILNAKTASGNAECRFVALDIGPLGKMLAPYGDLAFEDAVEVFATSIRIGVSAGADLIFIETMTDGYETKAALLAAKENSNLPVFVSNAYSENGRLMSGAEPVSMVSLLEGMGADAIGVNCSFGPKALMPVVEQYLKYASVPVLFKPNAGMPYIIEGKTTYDVSEIEFSSCMKTMVEKGVRIVGGCCGTTPSFISKMVCAVKDVPLVPVSDKGISCISSAMKTVFFGKRPVLIGERINPTGKKRFKQALKDNDMAYVLREGVRQTEKGAHVLDVNVGAPGIDEASMLPSLVKELQVVTDLPLQMDTTNVVAMEKALRVYNGKALINSVNGKQEVLDSVLPLAKKYSGMVVALTLDDSGIPATAEDRIAIAIRILEEAAKYGLGKKDILFDPLALAVSADSSAAIETLRSVKMLSDMGCMTSLGVSNVSFGLPDRECINSTFFALALNNGLSAAIMNPYSQSMMDVFHSFNVLKGLDVGCVSYIEYAASKAEADDNASEKPLVKASNEVFDLKQAIVSGLKDDAAKLAKSMLQTMGPLDVIQTFLVPALDDVGKSYEKGKTFLPQLLMSAEAASSVFETIKVSCGKTQEKTGFKVVLATVKGDIHDIGKNIVRMLLENYGFDVIDLGKDVPPQAVLDAVVQNKAPLAGLSALMTTTLPSMEQTIALLKEKAPWCKIVVGGAVLTQEYSDKMGADCYSKDAMVTVRYAESLMH